VGHSGSRHVSRAVERSGRLGESSAPPLEYCACYAERGGGSPAAHTNALGRLSTLLTRAPKAELSTDSNQGHHRLPPVRVEPGDVATLALASDIVKMFGNSLIGNLC
jgi:hypothetical protein